MQISADLVKKYNSPAPRYTSYPTVPLWENNLEPTKWDALVKKAFQDFDKEKGLFIYPFVSACLPIADATNRSPKTTQSRIHIFRHF